MAKFLYVVLNVTIIILWSIGMCYNTGIIEMPSAEERRLMVLLLWAMPAGYGVGVALAMMLINDDLDAPK